MAKKLVEESLYEYLGVPSDKEVLKKEKKVGITLEDVDSKEFLIGMEIEKEHSADLAIQKTLTLQHLADNPKYYSEGMKKGFFDNPSAINLYKKYFIDKEKPEETNEPIV
jgi:hypothetical protein